jgi:7-carboxy-7-deazaguanine synthase
VTLETAATVYKPVRIDLASLSPKLSNSTPRRRQEKRAAETHERNRLNAAVIQRFIDSAPEFQIKFVMRAQEDLGEVQQVLAMLHGWSAADVLLMPEGTQRKTLRSRAGWIAEICRRTGYRYCPRLHVELYGNRRGA